MAAKRLRIKTGTERAMAALHLCSGALGWRNRHEVPAALRLPGRPGGASPERGMCAVTAHGLAAVVSQAEEASAAPSVSALLAYERVVEAIHASRAVIPLRYGCLMESQSAILRLLADHRQEYQALLGRLGGMTRRESACCVRPALGSVPGICVCLRALHTWPLCEIVTVPANSLVPEEAQLADQITSRLNSLLHRAPERGLAGGPRPPGLAVLSDAQNRRGTLSQSGPANPSSRRHEAVVERSLAAVQLRGVA